MNILKKSRDFIYRNARPLDMARWNYLFEDGEKEDVIKCLTFYQNDDGGFSHALEPDCWNDQSTPLQTWVATKIIKEIRLEDKKHPLVLGILRYLNSGDEFDGHFWNGLSSVKSNNNAPHAPWWSYTQEKETSYNPTASLIGFILKYADKNSSLYITACQLAREAFIYLKENYPLESMHETSCFVELYEYMEECQIKEIIDLKEFKNLLQLQIKSIITYTTDNWLTEYVCKPSQFISSYKSSFYINNEEIYQYECEFIKETQNVDGTWDVTWEWDAYADQWAISQNWWKADIIIRNVAFVKGVEKDNEMQ